MHCNRTAKSWVFLAKIKRLVEYSSFNLCQFLRKPLRGFTSRPDAPSMELHSSHPSTGNAWAKLLQSKNEKNRQVWNHFSLWTDVTWLPCYSTWFRHGGGYLDLLIRAISKQVTNVHFTYSLNQDNMKQIQVKKNSTSWGRNCLIINLQGLKRNYIKQEVICDTLQAFELYFLTNTFISNRFLLKINRIWSWYVTDSRI